MERSFRLSHKRTLSADWAGIDGPATTFVSCRLQRRFGELQGDRGSDNAKGAWLTMTAHHAWLVPTPFAALAFHPLDGYAQSLPYQYVLSPSYFLCGFLERSTSWRVGLEADDRHEKRRDDTPFERAWRRCVAQRAPPTGRKDGKADYTASLSISAPCRSTCISCSLFSSSYGLSSSMYVSFPVRVHVTVSVEADISSVTGDQLAGNNGKAAMSAYPWEAYDGLLRSDPAAARSAGKASKSASIQP